MTTEANPNPAAPAPAAPASAPAAAPAPAAPATNPASPSSVAPPSDPSATPNSAPATVPAAGDGQGGTDTAGGDPANTDGAATPEPYEPFELPEGFTLESERLNLATGIFREIGLTQEQAQKLVALYPTLATEDAGLIQAALESQRTQQIEQWGADSKAEFGAGLDVILKDAQAGVQYAKTMRPNILDTFDKEGWGNNADALWAFAELGKLSRGSSMVGVNGQSNAGAPESVGDRTYKYADKPVGRKPK